MFSEGEWSIFRVANFSKKISLDLRKIVQANWLRCVNWNKHTKQYYIMKNAWVDNGRCWLYFWRLRIRVEAQLRRVDTRRGVIEVQKVPRWQGRRRAAIMNCGR